MIAKMSNPARPEQCLQKDLDSVILLYTKIERSAVPNRVTVHERVCVRHPELRDEDIVTAWENSIASAPRIGDNHEEYLAIGFDGNGRLLETVAVRSAAGTWLIYHAMTPPAKRTLKELGLERG
jgi:hypothetical protein